MKDQNELETSVKDWLDEIKPVPPRNPQMASRGRAQFLGRVVSVHELPRQKGWISIFRKEQYAMNVLLSILVIAGLLFGGGATVSAAQDDLPNEPLYALKTWTEDLSLQLQSNGENKVNRLMELTQVRVQEMTQLAEASEPIPDQVQLRLEQHIQQALQTCLKLDDSALDRTLLQIRDRLHDRDQEMEQLQTHLQDQLQLQTQEQLQLQIQDQLQAMTQTRIMLRERLRLVDEGLQNHEIFRERVRNGLRYGQDEEPIPPVQNKQQNGQPTSAPGGSNTNPNGPNTDQNGTSTGPGEPNPNPGGPGTGTGGNTKPGGPNTNPGGTSTGPGSNSNDSGGGSGGSGTGGGGSDDEGSGGGGRP